MARPRKEEDLSIEQRIEAQTLKWIKIADKAAMIADLQLDGFLAQIKDNAVSLEGQTQIAQVLKDVLASATRTIETGLKTLAARRNADPGAATQTEEDLLAEMRG
jgi:hypothetical protein